MLAQPSTASSNRRPILLTEIASRKGWVAEEKLDGIRAIIESDGRSCRLWNRNGVDITARFPEIARQQVAAMVIDGEIVANDGLFQTVATRDKQTAGYASAAKAHPCRFVAFDLLASGGSPLTQLPYRTRRTLLAGSLGRRRVLRPVRQSHDILGLWRAIVDEGGEGVICKLEAGLYLPGKRAESWIKFKTLHRITAVAVGYEKGIKREFGAIRLALIDKGNPIPIGKVGTGWNEKEGEVLQARLDNGEMFLVEIEALNRTSDNSLRFPVWKAERTDLPLTAATADQLAALPVY